MKKVPVRVTFTTVHTDGSTIPFGKTFTDAEEALSYLGGYIGGSGYHSLQDFTVEHLWEEIR